MATVTLADLAITCGATLRGPGDQVLTHAASLRSAGPQALSFVVNPSHHRPLTETAAGAVIVPPSLADHRDGPVLIADDPYVSWARATALLHPLPPAEPGCHGSAQVADSASIDPSASIGPLCSIGANSHIEAGVILGPGCVVAEGAHIGAHSRLVAQVHLGAGCRLGQRVIVHPGAVIGSDGFGLANDRGHWIKIAQVGSVLIGDDCEIGANSTIDRGALDHTVLEEDVRIDNLVHIAHNVHIGAHTAIAACVGIAGSTRIGRHCQIAGASGIAGHLTLCDHVIITAMSTVLKSIDQPGAYGSGIPARPHSQWKRLLVRLSQLDGRDRSPTIKRQKKPKRTAS